MSSPNTNALITLINNAVRDPKPTAAGFKIVYIGKDKYPMSILEMAPVTEDGWKKSASFESLSSTVRGQIEIQNTADLISVISQEIPIDVTTAFMESTLVKEKIMSSMTDIGNLAGLAFLHSDGKKAKNLASCDLKDRISDLNYIKLGCSLDGSAVDTRVCQSPIDFQFCLKLPQSLYNTGTGTVVPGSSPKRVPKQTTNPQSLSSPREKLIFGSDEKGSDDPASDDSENEGNTNTPSKKTPAQVTPKMSRLFGSSNNTATISSFFGSTSFLDDQMIFDATFGSNPLILDSQPTKSGPVDCLTRVRTYADKCMFDIFLEICREDYVGGDDAGSKSKLVHEICKQIGNIKMTNVETPDEIYAKYISMVAGLPDDASLWSITLCASYYSALSTNLKDKMEESNFCMPPLNQMCDKASQISGLRLVRTNAVREHRALKEEEKRIRRLFPQMQQQRQHRGGTLHQYEGRQNQELGSIYYNNKSVAESTLQRYGGGGNNVENTLPSRTGADGRQYPFNPEDPTFLSRFEIGFRGCFKCGQSDHFTRDKCPFGASTSKEMLDSFYRELKIHKPAFRNQSNDQKRVSMWSYIAIFYGRIIFILCQTLHCQYEYTCLANTTYTCTNTSVLKIQRIQIQIRIHLS